MQGGGRKQKDLKGLLRAISNRPFRNQFLTLALNNPFPNSLTPLNRTVPVSAACTRATHTFDLSEWGRHRGLNTYDPKSLRLCILAPLANSRSTLWSLRELSPTSEALKSNTLRMIRTCPAPKSFKQHLTKSSGFQDSSRFPEIS